MSSYNARVPADQQLQLIMECRNSGLSDYQWCKAVSYTHLDVYKRQVGDDYESARKNVLKMSKSGFRIATAAKKLSGQSFFDKMRILFWKILTSIRGRETEFKRINRCV